MHNDRPWFRWNIIHDIFGESDHRCWVFRNAMIGPAKIMILLNLSSNSFYIICLMKEVLQSIKTIAISYQTEENDPFLFKKEDAETANHKMDPLRNNRAYQKIFLLNKLHISLNVCM